MKNNIIFSVGILSICFTTACRQLCDCHPPKDEVPCIVQKLEDWKKSVHALAIYEIYPPSGDTWFWLEDAYADAGEEIVDENCQIICITDIEGVIHNECQPHIFDYPRKKVWNK